MNSNLEKYKKFIFMGIIIIALGITFTTAMKEAMGSLGTVFIAIGGLFFIIGMNMKRQHNKR